MFTFNKMSYICVAINLVSNILFFLIGDLGGTVSLLIVLSNLILPFLLSFTGVLLGIGAIVLKESIIQSIIAIALNIIYICMYNYVLSNF